MLVWHKTGICSLLHVVFASAAVKKKPSSCLKEVEKIKQKREERRAVQQALREQQDLEYDTTAPNWEFGAMIRFES